MIYNDLLKTGCLGDEMWIDAPNNYLMNDTWISMYLDRGKVFSVMSCQEVHIIISDLNGVTCEFKSRGSSFVSHYYFGLYTIMFVKTLF